MLSIRTRARGLTASAHRNERGKTRWIPMALAFFAATCLANGKPNPSDCPARSERSPKAGPGTCGALWCSYYACAGRLEHAQCKGIARTAVRACTLEQDPTFPVPTLIRSSPSAQSGTVSR